MSTRSNEQNEEITAGNRPTPAINGEWNQQTIVDARNVLQTQQSNESSHQTNEQRSGKSKILFYFVYKLMIFISEKILVGKAPIYPNHVLHPEVIPSLNEVPAELNKRRNTRFTDPLALDSFETEIPLAIASSLQDELERAVLHRFVFF
jgi:hypothetical protein